MEITLIQGLLIGLVTAFCYSGMLLGIYTNRAIVMSFFVGLILGDLPTAIIFGALAELAYMGFGVGAGGTVPPNPVGPGIVGTIMVITLKDQGVTPESALALSFPFAVLFQFVSTALYTAFAGLPRWTSKAIQEGRYSKFHLLANATYIGFAITGFFIGLAAALSRPALQAFVEALPQWLINGFAVAGGLIPAIGFAMILSVMIKKQLIPYLLLGYVCIAYLKLPTMAVALVGGIFACIYYFNKSNNNDQQSQVTMNSKEDFNDGI
ncbi:PTS mannose/fructose/sorbose/N-acetylgalactosamine transporter subunit IIC [Testudinibacter aquarius]|uniref:PTS mannose/fructose/sorbose/N-acetylgalactosamine transporter subunit IIC n=1 Tax=Testudinibacter aquarius TaxID=1524974 RepID=A0A4R3YAR2_9PAST|nr:PTS mannose/fructose/sorbose/N-acetylgalactosamine transporter subunit IIC [Testudinibacter aquarius]KAE9525847.1 PTS N-acetylgalactosamine transporter subunit IIC [Testudinibacter aquarius]TCV88781.1 PTS system N-acetylgalactosamine-specific IIC component [Testudinibacter aquarius]TNG93463.1 PTS mannose/fructose/sorbose/N-acetylgalactosamine transporter subunit IIC [Testudinibacter aquarius]